MTNVTIFYYTYIDRSLQCVLFEAVEFRYISFIHMLLFLFISILNVVNSQENK